MRRSYGTSSPYTSSTTSESFVGMPQNETFSICKDICGRIQDSVIESVVDYRFLIKGKLPKKLSTDPRYVIIVEKAENGSIVQVNYSRVGFLKPATKEFIDPFFKEFGQTVPLKSGVQTQIKRVLSGEYSDLFGKIF